jgi:hypothetical protein
LVVFALSGLLHEYGTWAGFGVATGWHMVFFMANGLAVLAENWAPAIVVSIVSAFEERRVQLGSRSHTFEAHGSHTCHGAASAAGREADVVAQVVPRGPAKASLALLQKQAVPAGTMTAASSASMAGTSPAAGAKSLGDLCACFGVPAWVVRVAQHVWTLGFFIALGPLFVEPYRAVGFFTSKGFQPFGTPATHHVLAWVDSTVAMLMA